MLGDYVSNLETSQLSIAIWQGDVVLHNLKLKTSALDKFNLPVDVLEGYLGDLTLNIPWNDLKNKPVKIRINNVYLLAAPKLDQDYDPEEEVERALKRKFEKLEAAEMIVKGAKESIPSRDRQNSSFMTQLATKVIDNLQFSISNIHIRYEDRISSPQVCINIVVVEQSPLHTILYFLKCPFSVGFTLEELTAVSTDEFWNEKFISEETGVIYKVKDG